MNVKLTLLLSILLIVILAITYWLISPLFISTTLNEELLGEGEVLLEGEFKDADSSHHASGIAKVIEVNGESVLRFENFSVTNGPDLRVYLATDVDASDFIDLGDNKATNGNINYELSDIDLEKYDTVLIWCRAFSVLFGSAELKSQG